MRVRREAITEGIKRYVDMDLLSQIPDSNTRIIVAAAVVMFADRIVDALKAFEGDDGMYDIDENLVSIMERNGDLTVTIPAIPLVAPHEREMTFNSRDMHKLMQRIGEVA